jgi:hypothetical protein
LSAGEPVVLRGHHHVARARLVEQAVEFGAVARGAGDGDGDGVREGALGACREKGVALAVEVLVGRRDARLA